MKYLLLASLSLVYCGIASAQFKPLPSNCTQRAHKVLCMYDNADSIPDDNVYYTAETFSFTPSRQATPPIPSLLIPQSVIQSGGEIVINNSTYLCRKALDK